MQFLCQTQRNATLIVKFLELEQLSLEQLHLCKPGGRWPHQSLATHHHAEVRKIHPFMKKMFQMYLRVQNYFASFTMPKYLSCCFQFFLKCQMISMIYVLTNINKPFSFLKSMIFTSSFILLSSSECEAIVFNFAVLGGEIPS